MVQDVDKSIVLDCGVIDSPVFGKMPPIGLSGGVKTLILVKFEKEKIFNASRKGLVIGKIGNFEQAAKSMNLSHYNGLKGYKLVGKIFGKNLAAKIGWAHNKAFVKSVMRLGGAIVDIGGELSGGLCQRSCPNQGVSVLSYIKSIIVLRKVNHDLERCVFKPI